MAPVVSLPTCRWCSSQLSTCVACSYRGWAAVPILETGRKDDENTETGKAAQSLVPVGTWNLKFSATKKESELKSFKTPLGNSRKLDMTKLDNSKRFGIDGPSSKFPPRTRCSVRFPPCTKSCSPFPTGPWHHVGAISICAVGQGDAMRIGESKGWKTEGNGQEKPINRYHVA